MSFELDKFRSASLVPRTDRIKTPELAAWFKEGAEPVFFVRGLTGEEFYSVRQASEKRADMQSIANRIMSGAGTAIGDAIEELFGAVPDEYARRVEILVAGCVDPKLDRLDAVKLIKNFPSSVHTITTHILLKTGEGSVVGELKGCGEIPASATTST